jgi:cytochrome c peroxidase
MKHPMHQIKWISSVLAGTMFLLVACEKQVSYVFQGFSAPREFPPVVYRLGSNPVTEEGFELGRRLFYEPRFSRNNTISCGSCHIQSAGFTHHGHDVSHGIDDRLGHRNSPSLVNLAWYSSFNWDGGIFDLDLFPISPITNPVEMDESVSNVIEKLKVHPEYPGLFKKAFGTEEINTGRVMKALSQFMVMLVSDQSRYDQVQRGKASFTAAEQRGYALFQTHCNSCHAEPLFTDNSFRDNGIGIGPNQDSGRAAISLQAADRYKFKVPTLRNLSFTAPYMHDGRMRTLDAVLDHYAENMKATPNLDPLLKKESEPGIPLTSEERSQLKAFLLTLNDTAFIKNPLFAE